MSEEPTKKRVDESWKEQAAQEKKHPPETQPKQGQGPQTPSPEAPVASPEGRPGTEEPPVARFDLFLSGLTMEALIALGDMAHPTTRKQAANLPQAKYLIDLLGLLEEKTQGNLNADETKLLKDALYQLRMQYLSKTSGLIPWPPRSTLARR